MMQLECAIQSSLPEDIALKIVSSLQVADLCALGCCSQFLRELCGSDCVWESLSRERWPFLGLFKEESSSAIHTKDPEFYRVFKGWRVFYIKMHIEMARRASVIVKHVEQCSLPSSLDVGDYLKAVEDLRLMQLGFKDVEVFLFKPKLSVLLNLVGLHYCINELKVPIIIQEEARGRAKKFLGRIG